MILLLLLVFSSPPAVAEGPWSEVSCQHLDDGRRLTIRRTGEIYQVESNHTRHFLAGLFCQVPYPQLPLFACHQGPASNLRFQANLVTEKGFPKDAYGNYVERELLVVYLSYYFENAKGEQEQAENEWRFPLAGCRWK
jgi:hypothetical protein